MYDRQRFSFSLLQIVDGVVITNMRTAAASACAVRVSMFYTQHTYTPHTHTLQPLTLSPHTVHVTPLPLPLIIAAGPSVSASQHTVYSGYWCAGSEPC